VYREMEMCKIKSGVRGERNGGGPDKISLGDGIGRGLRGDSD